VELSTRQQVILAELHPGRYMEVKELAQALGVDASTIRRDLQTLARTGRIERIHGGVRATAPSGQGPASAQAFAATGIAKGARRLLTGGETVLLADGPITERLVPLLDSLDELTVYTTSLRIAEYLGRNETITVQVVGGLLNPGGRETYGVRATTYLREVSADWCFLEAGGVDPFAGFTTDAPRLVASRRAMLEAADRRCILAFSSDFGLRRAALLADVSVADLVITDEGLEDSRLPAFGGRVMRTALADSGDALSLTAKHGRRPNSSTS
jgi:DeoR family transcriptional regulator, aga operon transcriptional repressor